MKTKEELNELKSEVEALSNKLAELSEDELAEVTGGVYTVLNLIERLYPTNDNTDKLRLRQTRLGELKYYKGPDEE